MTDRAPHPFEHLQDWPDATPDDQRAFEAYIHGWTVDAAKWVPLFFLVCLALWWPADLLVTPDDRHFGAFLRLRGSAAVLFAVYALLFRYSDVAQRHVYLVGTLAYAFAMGAVGHALGRLGPDGLPWLADAYIGVVPAALIPMRLPERVAATFVVATSLPAAYFLPRLENFAAPTALGQVSFAVFAAVMSIVLGEVVLRTVRRSYLQGRTIARERAEIAALADTLAHRVQDQSVELRALAGQLQHSQEAQRRSLSAELHNKLGEELNAMRVLLETGARVVDVAPHKTTDLLIDLSGALSRTTHVMRTMVSDLQPEVLQERGLDAALVWLVERAERAELDATLRLDPAAVHALDGQGQTVLFRCVQEAITNTLRHAEASLVRVTVRAMEDEVEAVVEDDGVGYDPQATSTGFGVAGMGHAVRALGGRLEIVPLPEFGTRVAVTLPRTRRTVPL